MPSKCLLGCDSITDVAIHRFPNPNKDPKRFKQWLDIVGGLRGAPAIEFHQRRRICDIHFSEQCRNRYNRLNAIAVPTLFLEGFCKAENLNDYRIKRTTKPDTEVKDEECIDYEYLDEFDKITQCKQSQFDTYNNMFENKDPISPEPELKDEDSKVHVGYKCNICENQISGYVCVQCLDWDMCGGCEARGAHSQHYVLRLPGPKPYLEIQKVLECIRRELIEPREYVDDWSLKQEDDIDYPLEDFSAENLELSDNKSKISQTKVPIISNKTFLDNRTLSKKKEKQTFRLKIPKDVKLEPLQQSLNKKLVVNLKRLIPSVANQREYTIKAPKSDVIACNLSTPLLFDKRLKRIKKYK